MKLTDENKIKMYRLKKEGYSYMELSKKFKINASNVRWMVKSADLYAEIVLIVLFSRDIIIEVLILGNSIKATSLKYVLPNPGLICNCISKFKENGYNILEKPRGRASKMKKNTKNIEKMNYPKLNN